MPGLDRITRNPSVQAEIFGFAAANGWVFTHDLDFGALLAALRANRPSVVQVRCRDVLAVGPVDSSAIVFDFFRSE
jgi:predicted nuclease of predicted toxin-antitoxin system